MIFPSAKQRVPDLFNLRIIHSEVTSLEERVLTARSQGLRFLTVSDTDFTNTNINNPITLDTSIVGTTPTPGDINDNDWIEINGIRTTFISVTTLADIINQINANFTPDIASDNGGNLQLSILTGINIVTSNASVNAALGIESTIDLTNNTIRITSHGLVTGDQITFTGSALPVPINAFPNSQYYVRRIDDNTFSLSITRQNALENIVIDLTQNAGDFFTVKKTTDSELYFQVWKGYREDSVLKQRMDEVIDYFENKEYIIYRQTNPLTDTVFRWVIEW